MTIRTEHADVLIIGSGATGALAGLVLAQAGLSVVCLEQGGWVERLDHPHYHADWQWQRRTKWNADVNVRTPSRRLSRRQRIPPQVLMWNGVGGSTNVYGAIWPRFRPSDFRKGIEHGLAPDWPITYEDIDALLRRGRPADRRKRPRRRSGDAAAGDPYPPAAAAQPRCAQARPKPSTGSAGIGGRSGRRHLGGLRRAVACNGCGICNGCPRGSMSKFSISIWPKALNAGVELHTYARVLRIEKGQRRTATGAVYRRPHHRRRSTSSRPTSSSSLPTASARRACCSPRTTSPTSRTRSAAIFCTTRWSRPTSGWRSRSPRHMGYVASLISREFAETDVSRGFVNGFNFNCLTQRRRPASRRSAISPKPARRGERGTTTGSSGISATTSACM